MITVQKVASPFGDLALVWRQQGESWRVVRVFLALNGRVHPHLNEQYPDAVAADHADAKELGILLTRFLLGEAVSLPTGMLDWAVCMPFQHEVLLAEKDIPRGCVYTYQHLAVVVGSPRGWRAVGHALARNPFPVIIPCHRVVRSDGTLGGYAGGLPMKRALLEMEGWQFDEQGRLQVAPTGVGWSGG